MGESQHVSLGDVVDLLTGNPFKSSEYVDGSDNPKLLRGDNIAQGRLRWGNVKRWPVKKTEGLEKYKLEAGDVVLAMDRPWIEAGLKFGCLGKDDLPAYLVQRVARMRGTSQLKSNFLRYLIGSKAFTDHVLGVQTGTAVPHISAGQIKSFEFKLPSLQEQRDIAATLASLDDKIELNRRMNETLEAMARAVFRDWFVDFGPTRRQMEGATDPAAIMGHAFPPEKATTLAPLFPAKLGEEGLPEGWKVKSLGDVVEPRKGRNITRKTAIPGDVPVVAGGLNPAYYHNTHNVTGPVITASASGANAGFVRLYHQNIWASDCSIISREQTNHLFTLYALLSSRQDEIYTMQQGAAQPHIYPSDLKRLTISDAPVLVWQALEGLLSPMFELVASNEQENQALAEMRDLLLPRLMSGEIRLKNAEVVPFSEVGQPASDFATDLLGERVLTPEQEDERDAVIVAATVKALQKDDLLVGNVRVMKGIYLLRRKQSFSVARFERQAAGPYDRALNQAIKDYARERSWIREATTSSARGERIRGNRPASKYSEVEPLIVHYDLGDGLNWLSEHFKGTSGEWMECVATVDVAVQELNRKGLDVTVEAIKADIASDPAWKPKLSKSHFSDLEIRRAVKTLGTIF